MKSIIFILSILLFCQNCFAQANEHNGKIISSIKPVDSLVKMISHGMDQTQLIVNKTKTPHGFNLKPSDIKKINEGDIIFYISDDFEDFLPKVLENNSKIKKVNLLKTADLRLFKNRNVKEWQVKGSDTDSKNIDYHYWLDTKNAKRMLEAIKNELSKIYPKKSKIYQANYEFYNDEIDELYEEIKLKLKNNEDKTFMVFHDSFQYFEQQFNLNNLGYISRNPHFNVSIKSLRQNMVKVEKEKPNCVFYEPNFNRKFSNIVAKASKTKVIKIDPIGSQIEPSKDLYFHMMRSITKSYQECFKTINQ